MPRTADTGPICDKRLKLSNEVTITVGRNYTAKAAYVRAKGKAEAAPLAVTLDAAQTAERAAVSALDKHRKEHGC